jgi:nicotinate-nucleotide adenylyltransferase
MVDESANRIGIFGGTFDPPHLGHLIIAQDLMIYAGLRSVLFMPTRTPPHKEAAGVSEAHHRLSMLELAIDDNPRFAISLVDLNRSAPSYTADSLEILGREYPDDALYFLLGADSLRDLPLWHDPGRIARQTRFVVARRPGVELDPDEVVRQVPETEGKIEIVDIPLIDIASRDLRRRVREGYPIRYYVPASVERYIEEHRLYRRNSSPDSLDRSL